MRNEVCEIAEMPEKAVGVKCEVVELVKANMRWYGQVRRMIEERLAKRVLFIKIV